VLFLQQAVLKVWFKYYVFLLFLKKIYYLDLRKPAKRFHKTKLVKDSRRTLTTIRRTIRKQRYRKDLKMVSFIFKNLIFLLINNCLGCSSSSICITSWSTINFNHNSRTNTGSYKNNWRQTFRQKCCYNNIVINDKYNVCDRNSLFFFSFWC
jgi:hypothetical protein